MRSRSSPSVTIRRVCPEEMHSRSAVSTSLATSTVDDRGDRRHDLAGLLLVQVEDASQHPGLAGVEVPAGVGLGDQALELVRGAAAGLLAHVDPQHPQQARGDRGDRVDHRPEQDREPLQRARDAARDALRAVDRVELGDHLAEDQLHRGHDHVGEHHRDRDDDVVRERAAEGSFQRARERRRAERADRDRGHRDADLHGRDVLVDVLELAQRQRGAAGAFLGMQLQARAPRAHERVLRDHEERVDGDQQGRQDQLQPGHA